MENPGIHLLQTSVLLQGINKRSHFTNMFVESAIAEAEKRVRKLELHYLLTYEDYTKASSYRDSSYREEISAISCCKRAGYLISDCHKLVEELQKALDKLRTTEATHKRTETTDRGLQILMLHGCKTLAQESKLLQEKAGHQQPNNDDWNQETIDFKYFNREFKYMQKEIPRRSKKPVHDLLREIKEADKLREKAVANGALVGNPASLDSLTRSMENEIKLLKKVIRKLEKDRREKEHMTEDAGRAYEEFAEKARHLKEKSECVFRRWDEEKKQMLKFKRSHKRRMSRKRIG